MIRVQIADDHQLVRQGLMRILHAEPDITVVGEANDCPSTVAMVDAAPPDILLLDLSMPGRGGLDVLKDLRARHPALRVIVLTMHAEEQFAVRAMRLGAAGYLTKDSAGQELVAAIRAVSARGKYVSPSVAEALAFDVEIGERRTEGESLSERERVVFEGIVAGRTLTELADSMALSVKTVSTYRIRLLRKLGVRTNADLVRRSIELTRPSRQTD
jgi:DNA-binding NarL/FixJ family response regulator